MDDGLAQMCRRPLRHSGILAFCHGKNENRIPVASLLAEHLQRQNLKIKVCPHSAMARIPLHVGLARNGRSAGQAAVIKPDVSLGNLLFLRRKGGNEEP